MKTCVNCDGKEFFVGEVHSIRLKGEETAAVVLFPLVTQAVFNMTRARAFYLS